jgi:hypothetical protein
LAAAAPFQPDESQNSFIHFQRTIHHQWIAIFILNFLLARSVALSRSAGAQKAECFVFIEIMWSQQQSYACSLAHHQPASAPTPLPRA